MTPLLVGLDYSPWTQRAAWALHLSGIETRFSQYTPTLGEPRLRLVLGRLHGPVSVPVLLRVAEGPLEDSFDIALWATAHAAPDAAVPNLVPDLDEVRRWNAIADRALGYGRLRSVQRMVVSPGHLDEASSKDYPSAIAPAIRPFARAIAKRILSKYDGSPRSAMADALTQLRESLARGPYVLGDHLTHADLVMATMLEMVSPGPQAPRGPEERRSWTDPEFPDEFPDLLTWRNQLLADHPMGDAWLRN